MVNVVVLGLGMMHIFRVILRSINIKKKLHSFLEVNLELFLIYSVSSGKLTF